MEPRNDKSGKQAITHDSVLRTKLTRHYQPCLFFSDSTADFGTSLSRGASERRQASLVRGKATNFLQKGIKRPREGRVHPRALSESLLV